MLSYLLQNTFKVHSPTHIAGVFAWSNSTVCLQWIQGQRRYKHCDKSCGGDKRKGRNSSQLFIDQKNPADISSRGGSDLETNKMRMSGPSWLTYSDS